MNKIFKFFIIIINLFFSTIVIAQTRFYITVERSFNTEENISFFIDSPIENSPIKVRILSPQNVDTFLEGQLKLSRSYEEPNVNLNSAFYFIKGINSIRNPIYEFRKMFAYKFRKPIADKINNSVNIEQNSLLAEVPPSIIIKTPKNVKIVREFFVDLLDSENKNEISDSYSSPYLKKLVKTTNLTVGLYLIQAIYKNREAQALLQVSDLFAQITQSDNNLLLRVIDKNLKPIKHAELQYRNINEKWETYNAKTNDDGQVLITNRNLANRLMLRVHYNKQYTYLDTEFVSASPVQSNIFLFTDRPIFKSGDTVNFKGILRQNINNQQKLKANNSIVKFNVVPYNYQNTTNDDNFKKLVTLNAKINEYSTFNSRYNLSEEAEPGLYNIKADINGENYSGDFRVKDYKKPLFYIENIEEKGSLRPNSKFNIILNVKRFSGGNVNEGTYDYYIYRRRYVVPQWLEDAGAGISTGDNYMFTNTQTSFNTNTPELLYSSINDDEIKKEKNQNSENRIITKGKIKIEINLPNEKDQSNTEWTYTLSVIARDNAKNIAYFSRNYLATISEISASLKFSHLIINANPTTEYNILVKSFLPEGGIAKNASGEVILFTNNGDKETKVDNYTFMTNTQGIAKIILPKNLKVGKYSAVVNIKKWNDKKLNKEFISDKVIAFVGGKKGEKLDNNNILYAISEKSSIKIGEKVKILVILPKNWANNEEGYIWQSLSSDKIYDIKAIKAKGRSHWFEIEAKEEYGNGIFVNLTIANKDGKFEDYSLPIRIIKPEKILSSKIEISSSASPNKDYSFKIKVIDYLAKPVTNTEVSVSIIDKAVYSLQAEFRPKLVDFFFPLPRNNIMTFLSRDLQGYGYSDELLKPNFEMNAIKSQTTLINKNDKDTAGWFPNLITDNDGYVEVKLKMPTNITEWLVTAIVVDKNGRFGENTAEFKTTVDVVAHINFPGFMRNKDIINANINYINNSNKKKTIEIVNNFSNNLKVIEKNSTNTIELNAKQEQIINYQIEALEENGNVYLDLLTNKESVGGLGKFEFGLLSDKSLIEYNFSAINSNMSDLKIKLPENAEIKQATFALDTNLLGLMMQKLDYLVNYPYGCTEQLSHSILANAKFLKIYYTLHKSSQELGSYIKLSDKAVKNILLGADRLILNQYTGQENEYKGGFNLFGNNDKPNLYYTALALNALEESFNIFENNNIKYDKKDINIKKLLELKNSSMYIRANDYMITNIEDDDNKLFEDIYALNTYNNYRKSLFIYKENWLNKIKNIYKNSNFYNKNIVLNILHNVEKDNKNYSSDIKKELKNIIYKYDKELFNETSNYLNNIQASENWLKKITYEINDKNYGFNNNLLATTAQILKNIVHMKDISAKETISKLENILFDLSSDNQTYASGILLDTLLDEYLDAWTKAKHLALNIELKNSIGEKFAYLSQSPGGFFAHIEKDIDANNLYNISTTSLDYTPFRARANFLVNTTHENAVIASNGIRLNRVLYKLNNGKLVQIEENDDLKIGDTILSVLQAEIEQNIELSSNYVIIEDFLPSLAVNIEDDAHLISAVVNKFSETKNIEIIKNSKYPSKNEKIAKINGKKFILVNTWEISFAGKASIPPAKIIAMYNEKYKAWSSGLTITAKNK